jgi:retron-type reverse transcriptase
MNHEVLLAILSEKIHDKRFLRFIRHLLESGYLEEWKFNKTLSGCPQGGVISPILSNIYLDKLDQYVEKTLIPAYTRGKRRAANPAYVTVKARYDWKKRQGRREEAKSSALTTPTMTPIDDFTMCAMQMIRSSVLLAHNRKQKKSSTNSDNSCAIASSWKCLRRKR